MIVMWQLYHVLCGAALEKSWHLQIVKNTAARLLMGAKRFHWATALLRQFHWLPIVLCAQQKLVLGKVVFTHIFLLRH